MPRPRACRRPSALVTWGLWADPAPGRYSSPPRPSPLPLPTWGAGEVSRPTPAPVPGGFSQLGWGQGAAEPPSSAWDGAPSCCLSRGSACDSPALLSGAEPGKGRGRADTRRGWAGAEPDSPESGTGPREGQPLA